jgi:hypothetical protein
VIRVFAHNVKIRSAPLAAIAAACVCAPLAIAHAAAKIHLAPKLTPGETLVYTIETTTTTAGKAITPITDSEGATESSLTISMRERLEVLGVKPSSDGEVVQFRLTWDESHAQALSDSLDPTASDAAAPFAQLEGHALEFTLAPDGAISNFKGLAGVFPGGVPPAESVAWISSLTASRSFPREGIALGQQWKAEQPINGAPLAGLVWQMQSRYDRHEPCPAPSGSAVSASAAQPAPGASAEQCAAILSQMTIVRHGAAHGDETPEDYLRNGLRTFGTWTGSGQELSSISIPTGLLVSATETSTQNMDYQITSASSGSSIHYVAKVDSRTGVSLVSESQNPPAPVAK